ncbi:uncharacterized protein LOC110417678 [Herrania umbratica]|uniref:Uncharacterized protein LOC110417678 n=1 Tax=Herrania umbratica TaxID=108875 RepID=A0A6J1AG86_9ROSI|nr:uncharacterized protein LOC110417678 [Herrania umbratica]
MDDSFNTRVEKIFGSLQSSQSSPLQQQRPPLWSLTDDEVKRREWRRDSAAEREEGLCSSSFLEFLKEERRYRSGRLPRKELEDDLDNVDDDEDDGDSSLLRSRRIDGGGDEWEIRSFIGMDSTLDNEEEEDEYDKVASGRENAGERLYMSDIADHGSYLNSQNVLYSALNHASNKVFPANHMVARIGLKEDYEEAWKLNNHNGCNAEIRELNVEVSNNGCQLRSILKRKDNYVGFKPQKRVRFDSACKNDFEDSSIKFDDDPTGTFPMSSQDSDCGYLPAENACAVPDYINFSRYTGYSFDSSSEVDKESNAQVCMYFLKLVQKTKPKLDDVPWDVTKLATFNAKRKAGNIQPGSSRGEVKEEDESKKSLHQTKLPVGIGARATQHYKVGATEDDESETSAADAAAVVQKCIRSYRVKSRSDDSDV